MRSDNDAYREYYVRDAQGNIMATYRFTNQLPLPGVNFKLTDRPIYGSSRVGSFNRTVEMYGINLSLPYYAPPVLAPPMPSSMLRYELNDHLGNVATVVTGQLLPGGLASAWQSKLISASGYEPGGSLLPGRNYSSSTYDYGFNGMRKDDEIHGATGTSYDFGARLYDPRVGRWLSLDPLARKFADQSPYSFANDNPIYYVDPNGKTGITYLTVIDKLGHETKITLVDHEAVKSYDHYSHFWDDGTTWTSKWDYSQTATLDFRNNPKGTLTVTSDPNLIRRVDWRASVARWIQNPAAGGGMVMSSENGEGGAPPGFGDGRILNVDGLTAMLGGASTTSKSKLKSIEDVVELIGQWAETYNRTDAALEEMGVKIELGKEGTNADKAKPAEPDPNDTICCGNGVLHLRKDSATHSNPITPPSGKTVEHYKK